MVCENISYLADGTLAFAGISVKKLAQEYGTPLYLLDADRIRNNCKIFAEAFSQLFPAGSLPLYAGKANCISAIYPIVREAGLGIDVVSSGEIYTAFHAGFPMEKAFFHGNNKTDEDLRYALDSGVGVIVVDGEDELKALNKIAHEKGKKQPILLRITPGIDPHTYEAVTTGKVDSKFGSAIATGEAARMVSLALDSDALLLEGFHCHVGSQVFGEDVFERSVAIMIGFMAEIRDRFGYEAGILDLGGGFGVRYTAEDPVVSVRDRLVSLSGVLKKECEHHGLKAPAFMMEPGRSIVADAGMTVYTVGSVKKIPGAKNYVSVDGGMTDNPRYALYRSRYTVLPGQKSSSPEMICSLVGRCCESGDILAAEISLPETVSRGDLVAVCTTGAYNYSMASNYNRIPRPPVVLLSKGEARLAVRRETAEDLTRLDLLV